MEEDNSFENSTLRREEKDWELKLFNVDDGTNTTAAKIWTVPWSLSHVVVVMMLWIVSFLWTGQSFVPWATFHMGFGRRGADKSRRGGILFVCRYRSVCSRYILRVVRDKKISRRVEKHELVSGYVRICRGVETVFERDSSVCGDVFLS